MSVASIACSPSDIIRIYIYSDSEAHVCSINSVKSNWYHTCIAILRHVYHTWDAMRCRAASGQDAHSQVYRLLCYTIYQNRYIYIYLCAPRIARYTWGPYGAASCWFQTVRPLFHGKVGVYACRSDALYCEGGVSVCSLAAKSCLKLPVAVGSGWSDLNFWAFWMQLFMRYAITRILPWGLVSWRQYDVCLETMYVFGHHIVCNLTPRRLCKLIVIFWRRPTPGCGFIGVCNALPRTAVA